MTMKILYTWWYDDDDDDSYNDDDNDWISWLWRRWWLCMYNANNEEEMQRKQGHYLCPQLLQTQPHTCKNAEKIKNNTILHA